MKNKILIIGIIILTGTALALGYSIVKQKSFGLTNIFLQNSFETTFKQEEVLQSQPPALQEILPSAEELGITQDEHAALNTPPQDISIEEKQEHFELVEKIAKEAPFLDITKCEVANPIVLRVKQGNSIVARNQDDKDHAIVLDADNIFIIPAGSTEDIITPNFKFGPGVYGYGCDQIQHAVGIFLVDE